MRVFFFINRYFFISYLFILYMNVVPYQQKQIDGNSSKPFFYCPKPINHFIRERLSSILIFHKKKIKIGPKIHLKNYIPKKGYKLDSF